MVKLCKMKQNQKQGRQICWNRQYALDSTFDCHIQRIGISNRTARHELCGAVNFGLFEAENGDGAVALHSGHSAYRSFSGSRNLCSPLGVIQQQDMLTGPLNRPAFSMDNNLALPSRVHNYNWRNKQPAKR